MKFFSRLFSFKKVAIIKIQCTIPQHGEIILFNMDIKLYENKYGERKSSFGPDDYPVSSTFKSKELIDKFLNGQCTPEIPSYSKIITGEKPIKLEDATYTTLII